MPTAANVATFEARRLEVAKLLCKQHCRVWTGISGEERTAYMDAAHVAIALVRNWQNASGSESGVQVVASPQNADTLFWRCQACGTVWLEEHLLQSANNPEVKCCADAFCGGTVVRDKN